MGVVVRALFTSTQAGQDLSQTGELARGQLRPPRVVRRGGRDDPLVDEAPEHALDVPLHRRDEGRPGETVDFRVECDAESLKKARFVRGALAPKGLLYYPKFIPKTFDYPKEWDAFVGHYRNENNWIGSTRITLRKGALLVDGATALVEQKDGSFRTQGDEADTEWIRFHDVVDGHAQRIKFSGEDLWRVVAP